MLKIDSTKNISTPSIGRSKANSVAGDNSHPIDGEEASVETSDFARVLENLSKEPKSEKTFDQSKEVDKKTDKSNEKSENKLSLKDEHNQKSTDRTASQDAAAAAAASSRASVRESSAVEAEQFVPPARSMMHVADLERIVSSFRTQLVDGNQQVVITLKNSVFSGLRIKLTTDENRRVTAEFVAANEKIKAQLDLRTSELSSLLRQRGVNVESLQTSVDAGLSENNSNQRQADDLASSIAPSKISRNSGQSSEETATNEIENLNNDDFNSNSYRA